MLYDPICMSRIGECIEAEGRVVADGLGVGAGGSLLMGLGFPSGVMKMS